MNYRRLGRSGLEVSTLTLGTMMFGDRTDEATAREIVAHARDAGVNFIDTADAYATGASERITGQAIRAERDRWVLATKVGNRIVEGERNNGGLSRSWVLRACDGSLGRLGTTSTSTTCIATTRARRSTKRSARSATSSARARCAISACRTTAAGASPR